MKLKLLLFLASFALVNAEQQLLLKGDVSAPHKGEVLHEIPKNKHLKIAGDVVDITKDILDIIDSIPLSDIPGIGNQLGDSVKFLKNIVNNFDPLFDKVGQFLVDVELAKEAGSNIGTISKCSFKPNDRAEFINNCIIKNATFKNGKKDLDTLKAAVKAAQKDPNSKAAMVLKDPKGPYKLTQDDIDKGPVKAAIKWVLANAKPETKKTCQDAADDKAAFFKKCKELNCTDRRCIVKGLQELRVILRPIINDLIAGYKGSESILFQIFDLVGLSQLKSEKDDVGKVMVKIKDILIEIDNIIDQLHRIIKGLVGEPKASADKQDKDADSKDKDSTQKKARYVKPNTKYANTPNDQLTPKQFLEKYEGINLNIPANAPKAEKESARGIALDILELTKDNNVTERDVSSAFRRLSLKFHPDKNLQDTSNVDKAYMLISQAHDLLIDLIK